MARIAVFDSGLGSLSIIREIQREIRCEIIYLADRKNFPYGSKTRRNLEKITMETIATLRNRFSPDVIVVGSNTPSILLDIESEDIFTIRPPVREASQRSVTKNVAILATRATIRSRALSNYISGQRIPVQTRFYKINCSSLVEIVESGRFARDRDDTRQVIRKILQGYFKKYNIDVATLSSTHLPFLRVLLEEEFPGIVFLDPARDTAKRISAKVNPAKKSSLRIYTTDDTGVFERNLRVLGIRNRVISL